MSSLFAFRNFAVRQRRKEFIEYSRPDTAISIKYIPLGVHSPVLALLGYASIRANLASVYIFGWLH
jgi:hypothetical protein